MNIERYGTTGIVRDQEAGIVFSYERDTPRDLNLLRQFDKFDWDNQASMFDGEFYLHPYGNSNDLPTIIKNVLFENHIAPGLLTKKTQLLWGQGPKLYKEVFVKDNEGNTQLVREWQDDAEIQDWLDSWDAEEYLTKQCVDFNYISGTYTKFARNRGVRIGQDGFIASLEHVVADKGRLATRISSKEKKPTHVIVSDHSFHSVNALNEYRAYPVFDFRNPLAHPNSILYSNMYSFCMDYYSVPDIYGALEWLRRSSATPYILTALSDNSLNIKYHITSPQAFWDAKEKQLQAQCEKENKIYKASMLADYETELFRKITKVLGGAQNVGKIWHTKDVLEAVGGITVTHGWKITPIEQNIKDFVSSNLEISKRADYIVTAAIGLHPAIANISDSGKANGGSEQVYALQGYLLSGIDIPERITTKAINYAIMSNFPKKKLKLGYFQKVAQKQSDISPSNRIKEIQP